MSARSMPMPKALVATTMSSERSAKRVATSRPLGRPPCRRGTRPRSSPSAAASRPIARSVCASPRRRWRRREGDRASPSADDERREHLAARLVHAVDVARREVEVGAREAAQDLVAVVAQAQRVADLAPNLRRRRGRAGEHARRSEPLEERADAQVVGPEVVPPLRDAVRLVDRDELHVAARERVDERVRGEPLGRGVHELVAARAASPPRDGAAARGSSVEARNVAETPRASSARTWSSMSATSGESTSVIPPSTAAGTW